MAELKVLLVDDHLVVRMGFKMLIDSEKDMKVIAESETGEDGIQKYQELKPDVTVT
jgi:two-component system, NarL family, invasion response regulator UvrY